MQEMTDLEKAYGALVDKVAEAGWSVERCVRNYGYTQDLAIFGGRGKYTFLVKLWGEKRPVSFKVYPRADGTYEIK